MLQSLNSHIKTAQKGILFVQSTLLVAVMMVTYILYCTKDTLMVQHVGPEAVVFARTYLVAPVFFLFFLGYTKALNYVRLSTIFNTVIFLSFSYFLIFSFYLYPNLELFCFPSGIELVTLWPITLYYLISELWVVFVLGVMTWQAFNAVNSQESARTGYYFLQLVANLSLLVAGQALYQLGVHFSIDWQTSLQGQTLLIIFFALVAIFMRNKLYNGINHTPPEKLKLSVIESIRLLFSSTQIRILFIAILSYGICNSFLETSNRYYLKATSGSIQEYNTLLALQTSLIGIFTILFIFLGAFLSAKKWYRASLIITPFLLILCSLSTWLFANSSLLQVLALTQLVIVKSSKYGLIDPIKEIVFISLDDELKNKGKAAIDGLSNRMGKTGGNLIQQLLFLSAGGLSLSIDTFGIVVFFFALLWLAKIRKLEL